MSQYNLKINGKEYNVCVDSVKGDHAEVTVNGNKYEVEIARPKPQIEIPSIISQRRSGSVPQTFPQEDCICRHDRRIPT